MKLDKNYKVRVTPEQSRKIQELVFKLGGSLQSGDTFVKETHLERLYVSKCLKMSFGLTEHGWSYQEGATIQADDLIALLTDLSKSDMEIDITQNSVDNNQANTQDNSANIQDSRVNIQAPHVSSPSNDGATYVSEPCNDVLFPRFEVGQKAYCPWLNDGELVTLGLDDNGDLIAQTKKGLQAFDCEGYALDCTPRQPDLFPATDYYFEHLSAIMPWIKFEQPPKPLTGDELVRQMILLGIKNVLCFKNGTTDKVIIDRLCYEGSLMTPDCVVIGGVTPIDWYTGEPLTEAVLDE